MTRIVLAASLGAVVGAIAFKGHRVAGAAGLGAVGAAVGYFFLKPKNPPAAAAANAGKVAPTGATKIGKATPTQAAAA